MKPVIAIVTSRFNEEVTQRLHLGATQRLQELGFESAQIIERWVPGAVEIPVVAQQLAMHESIDAVICLGVVVRGETGHYDFVCKQVSDGCQKIALEQRKPIIFGILTTENQAQALARTGGEKGDKGRYCADAAIEMLAVLSAPV